MVPPSLREIAEKLLTSNVVQRGADRAFLDDGLPDIEPTDPADIPPDEGDIGHGEEV